MLKQQKSLANNSILFEEINDENLELIQGGLDRRGPELKPLDIPGGRICKYYPEINIYSCHKIQRPPWAD